MSNINEIQRIVKNNISDNIWDVPDKLGWFNSCIFGDKDVDFHTLSIKIGQSMEKIYTDIAKLRYPGKLLPRAIPGHGVTDDEAEQYWTDKYNNNNAIERKNAIIILTRLDAVQTAEIITGEVERFYSTSSKNRLKFTHNIMQQFSDRVLSQVPLQQKIREVYADLCPFIDNTWTLMEIKMSGNTDKGKTKQVFKENMISPYICLGNKPKKVFYGIITNSLGTNKKGEWKGQLGGIVSQEMILVEEKLFDLLSPIDVNFHDFVSMVSKRIEKLRP